MKCPECGFVSFPGLERCKKCGHRLTQLPGEPQEIPPLFYLSLSGAKAPAVQNSASGQQSTETAGRDAGEMDIELKPESKSSSVSESSQVQPPIAPSEPQDGQNWQSELAERVHEYRQRRSRLRNTGDDNGDTMDLDFEPSAPSPHENRPNVIEFPSAEQLERQAGTSTALRSASRPTGLENFESSFQNQDSGITPGPWPSESSPDDTAPLQIELGSSRNNSAAGIRAGETTGISSARMSSRLFAGILDAMVLLSGAALYVLIFWRAGGSFSLQPTELATGATVGVFFVMLYFAGCTAMSSATPGLIWAGLEITTFEGNPPGISDCLWRAFGYLVSMSALMLGFIWAAVDADGLTWHDRMSRTFVVPADHQ